MACFSHWLQANSSFALGEIWILWWRNIWHTHRKSISAMGTHTYTIYSFCTLAPIQARHLEASEHDPHRGKRRAPQQWPPAGQDRTWDVEAWLVVRIFHEVKTLYINYYWYYYCHKVKTLPGVLSLQVSPALSPVGVETPDELPRPHRGTRAE